MLGVGVRDLYDGLNKASKVFIDYSLSRYAAVSALYMVRPAFAAFADRARGRGHY